MFFSGSVFFFHLHFQVPCFVLVPFLLSPLKNYVHQLETNRWKTHTSAPEQSVPNFKALDPSPLECLANCCLRERLQKGRKNMFYWCFWLSTKPFFGRHYRQSQNNASYLTWKLLLLQLQQEALGPSKFKIKLSRFVNQTRTTPEYSPDDAAHTSANSIP